MDEITSYSQSGQDAYAWHLNGQVRNGTFLDIGCNDPIVHSNTYGLELIGWTGICVDIDPFDYSKRTAQFVQHDARFPHPTITSFLKRNNGFINYLSLDADDATLKALGAIPFDECRFGAITIEHDSYRVGPVVKSAIYSYLMQRGYARGREDIRAPKSDGMPWSEQPYEDWYYLL